MKIKITESISLAAEPYNWVLCVDGESKIYLNSLNHILHQMKLRAVEVDEKLILRIISVFDLPYNLDRLTARKLTMKGHPAFRFKKANDNSLKNLRNTKN